MPFYKQYFLIISQCCSNNSNKSLLTIFFRNTTVETTPNLKSGIYSVYNGNMAFKRSFAPAIANSVNVKALRNNQTENKADGTAKSNKVAEGDLRF